MRNITSARSQEDMDAVRTLFLAYAETLPIDLAYQGFEAELAALPGKYAPPAGELLLARDESGTAIGCVGLRPFGDDGRCEMKRLYVSERARGTGLGEALADAVLAVAADAGYRSILLDTLPTMRGAISLYEKKGFRRIEAYYETPVAGTIFLEKMLDP